jgi:hypothetical protein
MTACQPATVAGRVALSACGASAESRDDDDDRVSDGAPLHGSRAPVAPGSLQSGCGPRPQSPSPPHVLRGRGGASLCEAWDDDGGMPSELA